MKLHTHDHFGVVSSADSERIFEAIREGLTPFRARTIHIYFEYDIDYNRYVIFAEVWFPDLQLLGRVDVNVNDFHSNLDEEYYKIAEKMFDRFRYRASGRIPSNIELGDN